jgi:hypothetical protein
MRASGRAGGSGYGAGEMSNEYSRLLSQLIELLTSFYKSGLPDIPVDVEDISTKGLGSTAEASREIWVPMMFAWTIGETFQKIGITEEAILPMLLGAMMMEPYRRVDDFLLDKVVLQRLVDAAVGIKDVMISTADEIMPEDRASAFTYRMLELRQLTWPQAAVFANLALKREFTPTAWRLRVRRWALRHGKDPAILNKRKQQT